MLEFILAHGPGFVAGIVATWVFLFIWLGLMSRAPMGRDPTPRGKL